MSQPNKDSTSPVPSPNMAFHGEGQARRRFSQDLPVVENVSVPPREETVEVKDYEEAEEVRTVQIPHTHIREEFEVVDVPVRKPRFIKEPRIDVLHRKIQIPKPVKKEKYVEMPQLHVVDRFTEKQLPIYKEKLVEKPQYIIQERIVPIPKRQVEEVTVKIPKSQFDQVVNAQLPTTQYSSMSRNELNPQGYGAELSVGGTGSQAPSEVAMPQRLTGPRCRHMPRPVDVPLVHYKPKPVERIVDRNVPVPVEMHVTQEFQCPILIPIWAEQAVPVHVTRMIEKPVPADAMTHKVLLNMYMNQTKHIDEFAEKRMRGAFCGGGFKKNQTFPIKHKMTDSEIRAAGLNTDLNSLKTMNSRAFDQFRTYNASVSGGFFTEEREVAQERNTGDDELLAAAVAGRN